MVTIRFVRGETLTANTVAARSGVRTNEGNCNPHTLRVAILGRRISDPCSFVRLAAVCGYNPINSDLILLLPVPLPHTGRYRGI